jgi:hypothetical protein
MYFVIYTQEFTGVRWNRESPDTFTCIPVQSTRLQVRPVYFVTDACILPGSSGKVVGNGGKQRVSSTFHQKKKSGVRPGERSDQDTGILPPIHFGGSFRSKKDSTHCKVKMRRLNVASCWNSMTLRPLSNWHKEFLQHAFWYTKQSQCSG